MGIFQGNSIKCRLTFYLLGWHCKISQLLIIKTKRLRSSRIIVFLIKNQMTTSYFWLSAKYNRLRIFWKFVLHILIFHRNFPLNFNNLTCQKETKSLSGHLPILMDMRSCSCSRFNLVISFRMRFFQFTRDLIAKHLSSLIIISTSNYIKTTCCMRIVVKLLLYFYLKVAYLLSTFIPSLAVLNQIHVAYIRRLKPGKRMTLNDSCCF